MLHLTLPHIVVTFIWEAITISSSLRSCEVEIVTVDQCIENMKHFKYALYDFAIKYNFKFYFIINYKQRGYCYICCYWLLLTCPCIQRSNLPMFIQPCIVLSLYIKFCPQEACLLIMNRKTK